MAEFDSGAPYYKARVTGKPVRRIDGTVIAKVSYLEREGTTIARFYKDLDEAMTLKEGSTVYVCPFDGDAYIKTKNHGNRK